MDQHSEDRASAREILKNKLRENFDGKIVRKDLTKKIKEGANVPVYVLEFLLGQYCSSDDDEIIIEKASRMSSAFWRTTLCARMRRRRSFPCCVPAAAIPSSTRSRSA